MHAIVPFNTEAQLTLCSWPGTQLMKCGERYQIAAVLQYYSTVTQLLLWPRGLGTALYDT
jgi:hypothetical protein